ncbi:uncharacterized protein KY384_000593 [Bacidia gigantensis]|uniref:uncharacterized protein n=1 Tax=Bacidia gigantensis TaxID=2732470 RepID=UPI001D04507B|nr:uncharacterized protein KY384_000593 [Bacidia gigantensis]KAG8525833.1 hypothetical protein KY384_000593 [Bacidia gigantensis]
MAGRIPEGLIETKEGVAGDISNNERVNFQDIKILWTTFATNRQYSRDKLVGKRLENLFWRIMSSERLLRNLSGEQIATQFNAIHEDGEIRTTPQNSPRSSRNLESNAGSGPSKEPVPRSKTQISLLGHGLSPQVTNTSSVPLGVESQDIFVGPTTEFEDDGDAPTPTPSSPLAKLENPRLRTHNGRRSSRISKPTPILKKSSSGNSDDLAYEAQRSRSPNDRGHSNSGRGMPVPQSTRFSEEVTVSIPKISVSLPRAKPRRNTNEAAQLTKKSGPPFIASTGASKRKPLTVRQRSSQWAHSKTSISPPSSRPELKARLATTPPIQEIATEGGQRSLTTSHQDWGGESSSEDEDSAEMDKGSRALSERNHQSRSSKQPSIQQRSFTNLSSLGGKAAASATSAPYHASGVLNFGHPLSAGKEAFRHETVALKKARTLTERSIYQEQRVSFL